MRRKPRSNAAAIARSQYQAGLIDFQSLLEAERSLLTTEDSRATARASRAAALVQLYKALGGGWDAAPVRIHLADALPRTDHTWTAKRQRPRDEDVAR